MKVDDKENVADLNINSLHWENARNIDKRTDNEVSVACAEFCQELMWQRKERNCSVSNLKPFKSILLDAFHCGGWFAQAKEIFDHILLVKSALTDNGTRGTLTVEPQEWLTINEFHDSLLNPSFCSSTQDIELEKKEILNFLNLIETNLTLILEMKKLKMANCEPHDIESPPITVLKSVLIKVLVERPLDNTCVMSILRFMAQFPSKYGCKQQKALSGSLLSALQQQYNNLEERNILMNNTILLLNSSTLYQLSELFCTADIKNMWAEVLKKYTKLQIRNFEACLIGLLFPHKIRSDLCDSINKQKYGFTMEKYFHLGAQTSIGPLKVREVLISRFIRFVELEFHDEAEEVGYDLKFILTYKKTLHSTDLWKTALQQIHLLKIFDSSIVQRILERFLNEVAGIYKPHTEQGQALLNFFLQLKGSAKSPIKSTILSFLSNTFCDANSRNSAGACLLPAAPSANCFLPGSIGNEYELVVETLKRLMTLSTSESENVADEVLFIFSELESICRAHQVDFQAILRDLTHLIWLKTKGSPQNQIILSAIEAFLVPTVCKIRYNVSHSRNYLNFLLKWKVEREDFSSVLHLFFEKTLVIPFTRVQVEAILLNEALSSSLEVCDSVDMYSEDVDMSALQTQKIKFILDNQVGSARKNGENTKIAWSKLSPFMEKGSIISRNLLYGKLQSMFLAASTLLSGESTEISAEAFELADFFDNYGYPSLALFAQGIFSEPESISKKSSLTERRISVFAKKTIKEFMMMADCLTILYLNLSITPKDLDHKFNLVNDVLDEVRSKSPNLLSTFLDSQVIATSAIDPELATKFMDERVALSFLDFILPMAGCGYSMQRSVAELFIFHYCTFNRYMDDWQTLKLQLEKTFELSIRDFYEAFAKLFQAKEFLKISRFEVKAIRLFSDKPDFEPMLLSLIIKDLMKLTENSGSDLAKKINKLHQGIKSASLLLQQSSICAIVCNHIISFIDLIIVSPKLLGSMRLRKFLFKHLTMFDRMISEMRNSAKEAPTEVAVERHLWDVFLSRLLTEFLRDYSSIDEDVVISLLTLYKEQDKLEKDLTEFLQGLQIPKTKKGVFEKYIISSANVASSSRTAEQNSVDYKNQLLTFSQNLLPSHERSKLEKFLEMTPLGEQEPGNKVLRFLAKTCTSEPGKTVELIEKLDLFKRMDVLPAKVSLLKNSILRTRFQGLGRALNQATEFHQTLVPELSGESVVIEKRARHLWKRLFQIFSNQELPHYTRYLVGIVALQTLGQGSIKKICLQSKHKYLFEDFYIDLKYLGYYCYVNELGTGVELEELSRIDPLGFAKRIWKDHRDNTLALEFLTFWVIDFKVKDKVLLASLYSRTVKKSMPHLSSKLKEYGRNSIL
eukprot:augustus_masked-scaffold_3-processed-gene-9.61-mRNA-1 protein AED:1.00 eAED:1.00 QI:0/-1/0/0/-1/1/1/0/1367